MSNESQRLTAAIDRTQMTMLVTIITVNVGFPLLLFVTGWPAPQDAFYGESSPINWFSTVQLGVLAVLGLAVTSMARVCRDLEAISEQRVWPWALVALGFAFLSMDEEFMYHERFRDDVLVPRGILTDVSWLYEGDVVLIAYAAAGAVVAVYLLADLRRYPRALILFAAALSLIGVAAVQDSLNLAIFKRDAVRNVQIVAEEVAEVWAQAMFALSLVLVFFGKLRTVCRL